MKYRVRHTTTYTYSEPVSLCHNEIHLTPRSYVQQTCNHSELKIEPEPAAISERVDYFGNRAAVFSLQGRHERLEIHAESEVDVRPYAAPAPSLTPAWEDVRDGLLGAGATRHLEAIQYVYESHFVKNVDFLGDFARQSFTPGRPILEAALDLTHRIHTGFAYDSRATNMNTSIAEVFKIRRGVCQDFAHLQIGCMRALGLPARYVSGYLLTTPPEGKERLIGADASHAWVSFHCPGFGWIDVDPTNDLIPSDKHVLVAWGRDYADVSPIKGVILGGGQHTITVAVDVAPLS
jgi:transglutaminase-like putative cysteine protease